jgi:hypothetical protein
LQQRSPPCGPALPPVSLPDCHLPARLPACPACRPHFQPGWRVLPQRARRPGAGKRGITTLQFQHRCCGAGSLSGHAVLCCVMLPSSVCSGYQQQPIRHDMVLYPLPAGVYLMRYSVNTSAWAHAWRKYYNECTGHDQVCGERLSKWTGCDKAHSCQHWWFVPTLCLPCPVPPPVLFPACSDTCSARPAAPAVPAVLCLLCCAGLRLQADAHPRPAAAPGGAPPVQRLDWRHFHGNPTCKV